MKIRKFSPRYDALHIALFAAVDAIRQELEEIRDDDENQDFSEDTIGAIEDCLILLDDLDEDVFDFEITREDDEDA